MHGNLLYHQDLKNGEIQGFFINNYYDKKLIITNTVDEKINVKDLKKPLCEKVQL